jgi:hypothetical protein
MPIKILLSFCLFGGTLCLLPSSESLGVPPSGASATISATATVVEPLGLIEHPTPDLHRQFLLYSPHASHTLCQVTWLPEAGSPIQSNRRDLVSISDFPASIFSVPSRPMREHSATGCLVTVICTEN